MQTQQSQSQLSQTQNEPIKILIATDNHLGYKENSHTSERYQDPFDALDEVFQLAIKNKVDFLLLGGDLFDQKHPSKRCLQKCVDIMKRYVFGDYFQNINMERNSEFEPNFANRNLNIGLPIFIINGNHDNHVTDDTHDHISTLDILHKIEYINYFGKVTSQTQINVKPLLFFKGKTRVALYGIGYIEDYQFNKLLKTNRVIFEDVDSKNYNILVIHQNRYKGMHYLNQSNFLDPQQFVNFGMNLIVWGHEHEPKYNFERFDNNTFVFQPGCTCCTKLIEAESLVKQAGLLTIFNKNTEFQSIQLLKSHRPMILREIKLDELVKSSKWTNQTIDQQQEEVLIKYVEQELENHKKTKYKEKKPLMRIKVELTDQDVNRLKRLENLFQDSVANQLKIFHFWKKKNVIIKSDVQQKQINQMNQNFYQKLEEGFAEDNIQLEDCINRFRSNICSSDISILKPYHLEQIFETLQTEKEKQRNPIDSLISSISQQVNNDYLSKQIGILNKQIFNWEKHQEAMIAEIQGNQQYQEIFKNQNTYTKDIAQFYTNFKGDLLEALSKTQILEKDLKVEVQNQSKTKIASQKQILPDQEPPEEFLFWFDKQPQANQISLQSKQNNQSIKTIKAEHIEIENEPLIQEQESQNIQKPKKERKKKQTKNETKKISSKNKITDFF